MALVIETGAGLTNGTSYASVAELRGYASARGATVPGGDSECEILLIKAMDRLHDYASKFVGDRKSKEQALDWPRYAASVEGWPIGSTEIPRQLVQAQCALAIEAQDRDLLPPTDVGQVGPVTAERVGPISVDYANTGHVLPVPASAKADALLRTLLKNSGLFAVRA